MSQPPPFYNYYCPFAYLFLSSICARTEESVGTVSDLVLSQEDKPQTHRTVSETSGYAMWFTAGGAIRIAHYDVNDDVITRKL